MRTLAGTPHALPSLAFGLLAGIVTTVHHLHAALVLHSDGPGLHVVWIELVLLPATLVSMHLFLRDGNVHALRVYLVIALAGFVGLGLCEGGWNHTAKIVGHLRLEGPGNDIRSILPPGDAGAWFHEMTGVATFVVSMLAAAYTVRFASGTRAMR